MRQHRWMACGAIAALAVLAGPATSVVAKTPRTGAQLRAALPKPGDDPLPNVKQFVGVADGVALALVVHRNGAAVGFLCDGAGEWSWFEGKVRRDRLSLRSARGARLTGRIKGRRVSARVAGSGSATAAAVNGPFALRRTTSPAGLTRFVTQLDGQDVEIGWILTGGKLIKGAGTRDGRIVATTNANATDTSDAGEANPPAGDPVPFTFLAGARCAVLVLKMSQARRDEFTGIPGAADRQNEITQRFRELNCAQETNFSLL